jgi:hypothetical protein
MIKMHARATGPYSLITNNRYEEKLNMEDKIWRNGSMGVRRIWSSFYIKIVNNKIR